jgi:DNA polymerase alpha subunit B
MLARAVPFSGRHNAGQIVETLNSHLPFAEAPIAPFAEPRLKFTLNTDFKKFSYKPMGMRLSESSEVLDEKIDEFTSIVQKALNLDDTAFGNAACQSTSEIVAVGRIASDTPEAKLVASSIVLETSRRMGAGRRVPLKLSSNLSYQFFPGQVVALRGQNASGEDFVVSEILSVPFLPDPRSTPAAIESHAERLGDTAESSPLNILVASGPYCADDNLAFEPLNALCSKAADENVDAVVLGGPFLDVEHPLIASGDFDLPEAKGLDEDATMATLFRTMISGPLQRLCNVNPNITVVLIPSVRDAVSRHVSWPQEQLSRKELGLPKQVRMMTNPCTFWLNEVVIGVSTQDILGELRREEVAGGASQEEMLTRLPRHLIEQRHYFPLFPPVARENLPKTGTESGLATGSCLDLGYLKLGEMLNVRPDVLITPSVLPAFARVSSPLIYPKFELLADSCAFRLLRG